MSELPNDVSLASRAVASAAEKLERAVLKNEEIDVRIRGTGATLYSLLSALSNALNKLADIIKPFEDVKGTIRLAPYTYAIFTQEGFLLIRSRPEHLSLNFDRNAGIVSVKSRNITLGVSPDFIKLKARGSEVQIATSNAEDFVGKVNEIRDIIVEAKKSLVDRLDMLVELQSKRR